MTGSAELFRRYHHRIRQLAAHPSPCDAWRAELSRMVESLDYDRRRLSPRSSALLGQELSNQVEHELLRSTDPAARAVLSVVLKHLDAV